MTASAPPLDALRRQIDRIDDRIHDLLMERSGMIEQIVAAKRDGQAKLRPGREAEIARRLVARHGGHFPPPSLVRIWREIINAFTCMQGPFSIAVPEPSVDRGLWELARDHFGGTPGRDAAASVGACLRAVVDGDVTLAVLPWNADAASWLHDLPAGGDDAPRICFGLPFVRSDAAAQTAAVAVGRVAREATGSDRSIVAIDTPRSDGRAAIDAALRESGLEPLLAWRVASADGTCASATDLWVAEISGHIGADDDRCDRLSGIVGARRGSARVLGGYAEPIVLDGPKRSSDR